MLNDSEVRQLVLDLLKKPTERDEQTKIGPSSIGDPCDYCVAHKLLAHKQKQNKYWLGAVLGTSMHALLEDRANNADTDESRFGGLRGGFTEGKVVIGNLEGYGIIKGSIDLYIDNRIIDYKSSKRDKVARYKLDGVPNQYIIQQSLYAWGLTKEGYDVRRLALAFVNRDGVGDSDVWVYSWDYDEQVAVDAWARLEKIWNFIQDGGDVETLESDAHCYYCQNILHRW